MKKRIKKIECSRVSINVLVLQIAASKHRVTKYTQFNFFYCESVLYFFIRNGDHSYKASSSRESRESNSRAALSRYL